MTITCGPLRPLLILLLSVGLCPAVAFAQDADAQAEPPRLLGIIPNYRTSPTLKDYKPLTPKQKFRMARDDSFDRGTFALAAIFGAQAQWTEATPSFGHGVHEYARYYTASLSDFVIGDFMTESVFPTALRQDPRYFRRGTGGGWSRFAYAIGRMSGRTPMREAPSSISRRSPATRRRWASATRTTPTTARGLPTSQSWACSLASTQPQMC